MAGRGRGRGGKSSMSFTMEQLGLSRNEVLPINLQPPPKFPPLEYKPSLSNVTKELNYLIELKRDFTEYIKESKNNVLPVVVKKDIERYSDRYQYIDGSDKSNYETLYDWSRMPHELKSSATKRKEKEKQKSRKKLKVRDVNVEKKLQELESKEDNQESDVEDEEKENDDEEDEGDAKKQVEGEDEEVDEEMDEGTDYVNSYFDNGEGYDDEDDNMDDGPVY